MTTVLHVTQSGGGVARVMSDIIREASFIDHKIVAPRGTFNNEQLADLQVKLIECEMIRNVSIWADIKSLFNLIGILQGEQFDLLHLHSSKAGMLGRLAMLYLKKTKPELACRPIIYSPHGWSFHENQARYIYNLFSFLERKASKWCDVIVAVSNTELSEGRAVGIDPVLDFRRIYNGVNVKSYQTNATRVTWRLRLGIPRGAFVYVSVGRLAVQKSPVELVRGFARLSTIRPDSFLILVGDGPLKKQVEREIDALGLRSSVLITGWVSDVRPYLWAANVSVLLSKWEAFGLAIIESLAAGLPCLTSRHGAMTELLNENIGMFVDDITNEALVARSLEEIRFKSFDTQELVCVGHGYSDTKMASEYIALYKELSSLGRIRHRRKVGLA